MAVPLASAVRLSRMLCRGLVHFFDCRAVVEMNEMKNVVRWSEGKFIDVVNIPISSFTVLSVFRPFVRAAVFILICLYNFSRFRPISTAESVLPGECLGLLGVLYL